MKLNFLFPSKYKKIGWILLIPTAIFGLITVIYSIEPGFLDVKIPTLFNEQLFGKSELFASTNDNLLNEILGMVLIVASLLVAFSKEKAEDEYIAKIRLESLVWAVYLNYGILFIAFIFVFGISFLWVMIFNMYTILWFFIIRFNWQISKLKNSENEE